MPIVKTVDVPRLRNDLKTVAVELKALKRELRRPGRMMTWQEGSRLGKLKWDATLLCATRASLRGRDHNPRKPGPEELKVLIAEKLSVYRLP